MLSRMQRLGCAFLRPQVLSHAWRASSHMPADIEVHEDELRHFPPTANASAQSHLQSADVYQKLWQQSVDHPDKFWGKIAESFHWYSKVVLMLSWPFV